MNWWNWRPLVAAISRSGLLDAETIEGLGYNGATVITADQARAIAVSLRKDLDPTEAQRRMTLDGTWLATPDDGTFHRSAEDEDQNYSLDREVLAKFIAFCEESEGFAAY